MGILTSPSVLSISAATTATAATGWYAVYRSGGNKAVALWALTKSNQVVSVIGLVTGPGGTFEDAEEISGFEGYKYEGAATADVPSTH
jgi:histidinol dehydrogenase